MKTTSTRSGYKPAVPGIIVPDRVLLVLVGLIVLVILAHTINSLFEEVEFLEYNSPASTLQYPTPY